jgi:outer membrane protein, heavy metal efflux system
MRVKAAQARCVQVGLYPNPVAGYAADEMGVNGTPGFQGGFVGQEIVRGGKLRLNRAIAAQEVQQAEYARQAQERRVLNDVRAGYYEVIVSQRSVALEEKLAGIGDEAVRIAEQLMKAKEVSRVDMLQARVEADSARLHLAAVRNRHHAAWQRLAAVLGTPNMELPRLDGDAERGYPLLAWEQTLGRLLSESPELAAARAGVARARCDLARQCAEPVPNIDVRARMQYDSDSRDTIAGLEVGLPLPLFNRNQGNIARAQAEVVAAQSEVRRVELQLQQRLASVFEQYATARLQVEKYRDEILPNAQTTIELVRAGYRQGEFPYLTMLTAQRTYFQVNLLYLEGLRELWTRSVEIEGLLLAGGLGEAAALAGGKGAQHE